jgi:PAS domain S-box-containing protein
MRSWSIERKTLTAFMGTAAILALVLIAAYLTTLQFVDSSLRARRALEAISAQEKLYAALLDMLSSQRALALTGEQIFLRERSIAREKLDAQRIALRKLTADEAPQQQRLQRLEAALTELLGITDRALQVRTSPSDESRLRPWVQAREPRMRVRLILDEMQSVEETAVADRLHGDEQSARLLYSALVLVSVGFIVGLGWLLSRILGDLDERQEVEARLQRANQFLESLLENIPTMIFAKDAKDLRFVRLNRAGEQLLGLHRDELLGKSDFDLFPAGQAEFFTLKDRQVLAQGDIIDIPMEEIDTRAQGRRILHTRKVPVRDESGKLALLLGISMDITEQKATELRIVRLNAELKRHSSLLESSNQELESFCYSVSHDLRAPLRAINGYAQLLEQEHSGRLSSDALRYVQTICAASERMAQLIDDLLEFARLGRQTLERNEVDMTAVARNAAKEVIESRPAPQPEVIIEELPRTLGDRRMLHLAWLNLLDNAVKYTSGVAAPKIKVWAEIKGNEIVYAVRDNGIGFDMRYYDKLFGVFQRLHANPEYPGTGVGLAITQRIIARHGGRIWGESLPGSGATFYFSMAGLDPHRATSEESSYAVNS